MPIAKRYQIYLLMITATLLLNGMITPSVFARGMTPTEQATVKSTPTLTPDIKTQIDSFLTKIVKETNFMGSVLVSKAGKVILSKGYGMANLELDVPNTPQTKFRIGSLTKQFTAVAILQLQQAGKLKVSDSVCQYVDKCPESWQAVTIHHLLSHTSGIHNFTELSDYAKFKLTSQSVSSLIGRLHDLPLDFEPGKEWRYSNSNYLILGAIVEKASGKSFGGFLSLQILKPAGLENTGLDSNAAIIKQRATGYAGMTANAPYIHMSVPFSAGAMYSTVEDLFKWNENLYSGKVLSQESLNEMLKHQAQMEMEGEGIYYGYGVVLDEAYGRQRIGHGGAIEGFRSELDYFPDEKLTIVVLCNREDIDPFSIADIIAKMMFGTK